MGCQRRPNSRQEAQRQGAVRGREEGCPSAVGEGEEEEVWGMSCSAEDLVRREAGKLLRVEYRGQFLCHTCLRKLIRQSFGQSYTTSQIERALDKVFESPGALTRTQSSLCGICLKTMPCLGAS